MKPLFEPFQPKMSPNEYKEIMKRIEECEGRVNYFILNSEKIREFSSKTVRASQDNASMVYENLPAEAWAK